MNRQTSVWVALCVTATMYTSIASADVINLNGGDLNFTSENQSMWGSGGALQLNRLDDPYFVGAAWDESTTFGGFTNVPGTGGTIPNPAHPVWVAAMAACQVALSRSQCINGVDNPFPIPDVPGLGSEPSTTLANPIQGLPVGAEVTLSTDGRIGFEFGVKIDAGSVNADVGYDNVTVDIPDALDAGAAGGLVDLNPTADLTGDDLNSQFPTIVLTSGLVFDVFAGYSGEACLGICETFGDSIDVDPDLPVVSFNEDGEGGIQWFGGDSTLEDIVNFLGGSLPSGFPAEDIEIGGGLLEVDLFFPQPNATFDGLDGASLTASGQDDLVNIGIDLDNIASLIATQGVTQNLYGGSLPVPFGSIDWDFIDVDLGPALDLRQEFTLTPTLMVDLQFSQPVDFLGDSVTFVDGQEWQSLPEMTFAEGETLVTPTFYLQYGADPNTAELLNELILDVNGRLEIDLLSFGINIGRDIPLYGFFGVNESWALDQIVEEFDIGQIPLYDTTFAMGGFSNQQAAPFAVQVSNAGAVAVPEPGTLPLLGLGLILLGIRMRRIS